MKTKPILTILVLLVLFISHLPSIPAQDYTQMHLPDGAKARLGKGAIIDVQLSPDNKRLAISSYAGVWLYDVSTNAQNTPLIKFDPQFASQIVFSPDSRILAISRYDKTIHFWNSDTGELRLKMDTPEGPFTSLKFSPDSKIIIVQNRSDVIWLLNVSTGKQITTFNPNLPKLDPKTYRTWLRAADAYVDEKGDYIIGAGKKDGSISLRSGKNNDEISQLVSHTYDSESLPIQSSRPYYHDPDVKDGAPYIKWVNSLNFAPDGKTLVSTANYRRALKGGSEGQGGPTEIWDVSTGKQLAVLQWGIEVTFSGDGKTLAILDDKGSALWDVPSRRKIAEFPKDVKIKFSGDGKTLIIIDNDGYKIWNIATQQEIAKHTQVIEWLENSPEHLLLSHDGTILVTADRNGVVALRDTQDTMQLRALITGYNNPFTTIAFSHDGKYLVSGGDVGSQIQIWNANNHKKWKSITNSISSLAITKDNAFLIGERIMSKSESEIRVWDIATGEQMNVFTIKDVFRDRSFTSFDNGKVIALHNKSVLTPYGEKLAIETHAGIEVWDIHNKKLINTFPKVGKRVVVSALSPDGNILAVGSEDAIDLWDTQTRKQVKIKTAKNLQESVLGAFGLNESRIYALTFSSDGKTLAAALQNKVVHLWEIPNNRPQNILKHDATVSRLAFSPNGKLLACGDASGRISLWDLASGQLLTTYNGHGFFISGLKFTPDGKTLASIGGGDIQGDNTGTILLWDIPSK